MTPWRRRRDRVRGEAQRKKKPRGGYNQLGTTQSRQGKRCGVAGGNQGGVIFDTQCMGREYHS